MSIKEIGDIIAVRKLRFVHTHGTESQVSVSIGKPQSFPGSEGYYCPFQISGIGLENIEYAAGVDAVQALQLVMEMIGAKLEFLKSTLDGELRWVAGDTGLGFPSS